jgi:hypothetical protein
MGLLYQKEKLYSLSTPNPAPASDTQLLPSVSGLKSAALSGYSSLQGAGSAAYAGLRASAGAIDRDERPLKEKLKESITTSPFPGTSMAGDIFSSVLKETGAAGAIEKKYSQAEKDLSSASQKTRENPNYKQEFNTVRDSKGNLDLSKLKNADVLLGNMAQALGTMAPVLAAGIATGGVGAYGTGALMEKGSAQQEFEKSLSEQRGIPAEQLSKEDKDRINAASTLYGVLSGATEMIVPGKFVKDVFGKKAASSLMKRIFVNAPMSAIDSFLIEGSTEGFQRFTQNVIGRLSEINKTGDLSEGVIDEAIAGALSGGPIGLVGGLSNGSSQPVDSSQASKEVPPEEKEFKSVVASLNENELSTVSAGLSRPILEDGLRNLTPEEKMVVGVALNTARNLPGANVEMIDSNLKLLESTGVKIPVTSQESESNVRVTTPATTAQIAEYQKRLGELQQQYSQVAEYKKRLTELQQQYNQPVTPVEKPVLPSEKVATVKDVEKVVESTPKATVTKVKATPINETKAKEISSFTEGADVTFSKKPGKITSVLGQKSDTKYEVTYEDGSKIWTNKVGLERENVLQEKPKSSPRVEAARAKNKIKNAEVIKSDRKKAIKQAKDRAKASEEKPKSEVLTTIPGANGVTEVTRENYKENRYRLTIADQNKFDKIVDVKEKTLKYPKTVTQEQVDKTSQPGVNAKVGQKKKLVPSDFRKDKVYLYKKKILEVLKLSPELKKNPVFVMKDGKFQFEGKVDAFKLNPEAFGLLASEIPEGTRIRVNEADLKDKDSGDIPVVFFNRATRGKDGKFTGSISERVDKALKNQEIVDLVHQVTKETNPNIRAVLQFQVFKSIVSEIGENFETAGEYLRKDMIVKLSRTTSKKDFVRVMKHEIRHHAFNMMPREQKDTVVKWFQGLSREKLIEIYGSENLLNQYEETYGKTKHRLELMADETANIFIEQKETDSNNPIFRLYRDVIETIAYIFRRIFKATGRNIEVYRLYKNVFTQIGGEQFKVSPGRIQSLIESGGRPGMLFVTNKESVSGGKSVRSIKETPALITDKGTLRVQEVFNSAWRKMYGEEPPKDIFSMLNEGFNVKAPIQAAFTAGKQLERSKSPAIRAEMREKNAIRVKEVRSQLRTMFKQKTATAQEVKGKVITYVKLNLPKKLHGQYLVAVKNAKTPKNLEAVITRIDTKRSQYERSKLVHSINDVANNIDKLPVDLQRTIVAITSQIELKKHTKRLLERLRKTKEYLDTQANDFSMPRRVLNELGILTRTPFEELSTQKLIDINNRLQQYNLVGRNLMKDKAVLDRKTINEVIAEIENGSINLDHVSPEDRRNTFVKDDLSNPDDTKSFKDKAKDFFSMDKDKFERLRLSLMGMDRLFNNLDGRADYTGPNYRTFKEPVDEKWNDWQVAEDKIKMSFYQAINELKLTEKNSQRIAIYAYNQQRGGRKKLIEDNGYTEEQIDAIVLNEKEMALYGFMRQKLDELHSLLTKKMAKENNVMLGKQENYFPMLTDYGVTKPLLEELSTMGRMNNVAFGSIKERRENAQQILKLDAFQVFDSYVGKATYFMAMDSTLSKLNKIASSDKYMRAVGENAQRSVLTWLDVMARKGGPQNIPAPWEEKMNNFNNNLSVVILGLRLTTIVKQPLALIDGAGEIGSYAFAGTRMILDEDWRTFMNENSSELRNRAGGDPAFEEISHSKQILKIQDKAMYPIKFIDRYTAGSVWAGAYTKKMDELGLPVDFKKPNAEALKYANLVVRKTQASGNFKDLPLAMINKYRTASKLFFKFQTFVLNRWGYLSEDLPDKMKNNKELAVQQIAFVSLSALMEAGISSVYYTMMNGAAGDGEDKDENRLTIAIKSIFTSFAQTVPFLGALISSTKYGSNPVPLIELSNKFFKSFGQVFSAEKMETKEKHFLRVMSYSFGVYYGIPTDQARVILEKLLFPSASKKGSF